VVKGGTSTDGLNTDGQPNLTVVCCIEAGRLEEQTVLMVESLRAFGGAFSNVPVLAVIGRRGPPLRAKTRRELDRLGVRVVHANPQNNPATWLNYANKVAAVVTADELAETAQIAWFDSDMFVLKEPSGILLDEGWDLAAQCHHLPPAVVEGDETNVPYWTRVCELFGLSYSDVPWTRAADHLPLQKLNFTSGLFTWRRGSIFAASYASAVRRLLDARIAQAAGEFFTADQVVLTPIVVEAGLRWKPLTIADHSIVLGTFLRDGGADIPPLAEARVLHYSNSFAPPYKAMMDERLQTEVPAFWGWLQTHQPDLGPMPLQSKALQHLLRNTRGIRYRAYARSTERAA